MELVLDIITLINSETNEEILTWTMLQDDYTFEYVKLAYLNVTLDLFIFLFQFHDKLLFTKKKEIVFRIDFDNIIVVLVHLAQLP